MHLRLTRKTQAAAAEAFDLPLQSETPPRTEKW